MTTTAKPEFSSLREKIAWEKAERAERYAAFEALFAEAWEAGLAAAAATTPPVMIVGSPTHPLGNDIDPSKPIYIEREGPCGFAWVTIRPGNSSFARWLVKTDRGHASYPSGVAIWIGAHGQSEARKAAHAHAMVEVLRASDLLSTVRSITAGSRLD